MPRPDSHENEYLDGKLIFSSPSSTSSMRKNYCSKRASLVAKRRRSSTPVHIWRMNARSPRLAVGISETSEHQPQIGDAENTRVSLSARKLGNVLWELNDIPPPKVLVSDPQERKSMEDIRRNRKSGSSRAGFHPHDLSNSSNSIISRLCDQQSSSGRKTVLQMDQKFHLNEHNFLASDLSRKAKLMESEAYFQGVVPRSSLIRGKNHLKDLQNDLVSSKELLKILFRVYGIGKQQPSAVSLATALYCQLIQALIQVDQLIQEKEFDCSSEINCHKRQYVVEKAASKSKQKDGIRIAFQSMIEELEIEKKLRRRAERINKRLEVELAEMRTSLMDAIKELKYERRTREIIEQVSYKIIRGVGEDKAEVEELKRKSDKVREELEKEREMLQLADEWREERVHMKLSEAKYHFEEKNAAVDQLRCELEAFLAAKGKEEVVNEQQNVADNCGSDSEREIIHPNKKNTVISPTTDGREGDSGEKDQEESDVSDSEDSDLHSIELNINNGYNWSHSCRAAEDDDKLDLAKENHEISSNYGLVPGNYFSPDIGVHKGTNGNFIRNLQHFDDSFGEGRPVGDNNLIEEGQRVDQTGEMHKSLQSRDKNSAGSKIILPRGLLNSKRELIRQHAPQNKDNQVCLGSKVAEIVKAIRESESKASLVRKNRAHSQFQTTPLQ